MIGRPGRWRVMCARFKGMATVHDIVNHYRIKQRLNFPYNPNVAPSESVPIVRSSKSEGIKLEMARFGLVPSWAKDVKVGYSMINARADTIREKPAFRNAYAHRRCIIPAQGFYEWKEEGGKKQPYIFEREDGEPLSLAGIWEFNKLKNENIFSFAIVTDEPNALIRPFHDRMPVCLKDTEKWLDHGYDAAAHLRAVALPQSAFRVRKMNPAMNKPAVKDPELIEPPA